MSAPAKKRPTEIQIRVDQYVYKYSGVPKSKVRDFLTALRPYENEVIPWREALASTISKYGEAAAIVRGSRIKEGMTQSKLAKQLKIPQQHVSAIEKGIRPIGKGMARRLARIFRTDYRVFL